MNARTDTSAGRHVPGRRAGAPTEPGGVLRSAGGPPPDGATLWRASDQFRAARRHRDRARRWSVRHRDVGDPTRIASQVGGVCAAVASISWPCRRDAPMGAAAHLAGPHRRLDHCLRRAAPAASLRAAHQRPRRLGPAAGAPRGERAPLPGRGAAAQVADPGSCRGPSGTRSRHVGIDRGLESVLAVPMSRQRAASWLAGAGVRAVSGVPWRGPGAMWDPVVRSDVESPTSLRTRGRRAADPWPTGTSRR